MTRLLTQEKRQWLIPLIALLLIGGTGAGVLLSRGQTVPPATVADANTNTDAAFVDNQSCAECHSEQFDAWLGSHHEQAMQPATAVTILGDFDNATFADGRVTSRFFQKAGEFFINTEGADGRYADFPVAYTFGIEPLQQYLLALPNGRLQAFTVAWGTQQNRWFSLYPDEEIAPGDPLHWTALGFTGNSFCIECHTTNMTLNYDVATDTYATTWDAVNVSCQACHGPGGEHVRWAQGDMRDAGNHKGLTVDFTAMSPQEQAETCAGCHSLRYSVSENDAIGGSFYDNYMPELLQPGLYHADGQMLAEVYNFGSFLQSKMYHEGVTCTTCHNPHTATLRVEGNQLCAGCHQPNPPTEQYPGLQAKAYDSPAHHFHPVDSSGATCVNCHMPPQTYMVVDPRHDHQFSIPRPDNTLTWGTPNACANCHADVATTEVAVAEWAVAAMNQWYGPQWQARPSVAGIFTLARQGDPLAEIPLQQVLNDPLQPAIVRATGIELAGQYGARGMAPVAPALADESPLVRAAALRVLANLPAAQKLALLAPSLADPVRGVQIEAANALADLPPSAFSPEQWQQFETAVAGYEAAQRAQADRPEGYLNLAGLYARMGRLEAAEAAYQEAIARDRGFLPAYDNLARFYYQMGQRDKAEETFRQGIAVVSDPGSLYYALGLYLVEVGRLEEAATNLAKAAELMPETSRITYNYGLLLQQLGRVSEAEVALTHAVELAPTDAESLWAITNFYVEQQDWKGAQPYAKRLNELYPNNSEVQILLYTIETELKGK